MDQQWYCKIVGEEVGPVTSEDLVSMLARGQIDPTDPVRAGTSGPWRPVNEILGAAMPQMPGGAATATAAPSGGSSPDGYGFLDDIARLEDASAEIRVAPRLSSGRSSEDILAGMADLEDADVLDMIPTPPSGGSTQELLAGLADAPEPPPARPAPAPQRPTTPAPQKSPAPATAPQANPAATQDMVQRLDAEYQRLRAQLTGGAPIETGSWHGQPVESGSWHGQPQWPGQPAPPAYGPPGYPQASPQHGWPPQHPAPPQQPGWGAHQQSAAPPAAAPPRQAPPPASHAPAPAPAAPAVKLPPPPAAETPRPPESPKPAAPPRPPEATAPKAQSDTGSAATDTLRDMAAAHIRASQASSSSSSFSSSSSSSSSFSRPSFSPPSKPAKKSKGGGGGFDFSSIDFTSKPVIITAAVVGVLVLGYFGMSMGLLSGMNAGPVYDETAKYYKDFKTASAKGPDAADFTAFYTNWKKAQPEMLKKLGNPKGGSSAYNVKQAVTILGHRIESFKMKLETTDQEMYEESLKAKLEQLKKEFGR